MNNPSPDEINYKRQMDRKAAGTGTDWVKSVGKREELNCTVRTCSNIEHNHDIEVTSHVISANIAGACGLGPVACEPIKSVDLVVCRVDLIAR
ncbi:hypothetical protein Trydic_g21144 [Trypoxylus dichotomus]